MHGPRRSERILRSYGDGPGMYVPRGQPTQFDSVRYRIYHHAPMSGSSAGSLRIEQTDGHLSVETKRHPYHAPSLVLSLYYQ